MDKIRVFIATDDTIFQEGLSQFLRDEEDLECVAKPTNGEDTVRLAKEFLPDVVIMDLDMPLSDRRAQAGQAVEIVRQLKAAHPPVAILMVMAHGFGPSLFVSLQAGVAGYLLKKTAPRELINAVRSLCAGEAVFNLEAVNELIDNLASDKSADTKSLEQLRPREVEVLKAAARGIGNKEIGSELGISERTVQTHLVNIFRKLDVSSRTEAVLQGLKQGWLRLDDLP